MIRAACLLTAANFILSQAYKPYFNLVGHGLAGRLFLDWDAISALLLPAVVILQTWRARGDKRKRRAIWIDVAVVSLWFLCFWGFVAYALTHGAFW